MSFRGASALLAALVAASVTIVPVQAAQPLFYLVVGTVFRSTPLADVLADPIADAALLAPMRAVLVFIQPQRSRSAQDETEAPFEAALVASGIEKHRATSIWLVALSLPVPHDQNGRSTCGWIEPEPGYVVVITETAAAVEPCVVQAMEKKR